VLSGGKGRTKKKGKGLKVREAVEVTGVEGKKDADRKIMAKHSWKGKELFGKRKKRLAGSSRFMAQKRVNRRGGILRLFGKRSCTTTMQLGSNGGTEQQDKLTIHYRGLLKRTQ